MNDNATAHPASEYDANVRKSIPYYDDFHSMTCSVVQSAGIDPLVWVDIGCGTGSMVEKACVAFPSTAFVLADPSTAMLAIASERFEGNKRVRVLPPAYAKEVDIEGYADVVTAIQSLHYQGIDERKASILSCIEMLRAGGIFITFENVRPLTARGTEIGKRNWHSFQKRAGKTEAEAQKHIDRFGVEYFPITVEEHLKLLKEFGFQSVELLWYSYMQAGFYCIK
jgi:tRNA (cmo5U34)-methyltransferase